MAPKKKVAVNAPASKEPARGKPAKRPKFFEVPETAEEKAARLAAKAAKSTAAKAAYKAEQKRISAELRELRPPANPKVIHPEGGKKPTEYTDELGEKICLRFATDPAFSLLKLNSDPEMPSVWWFYKWLIAHPNFERAYACAREIQTDLQAAELEEWSTKSLVGKKTVRRTKTSEEHGDEVTEEVQEYDNIERARLRVQTRQWLLSKYRPKKYGAQPLAIEASGADDALTELLGQFRQRSREVEGA